MKSLKKIIKFLWLILIFVAILALFSAIWYVRKYGDTGFMSIISTFMSPWDGCANNLTQSFQLYALLPTIVVTLLVGTILLYEGKLHLNIKRLKIYPFGAKLRRLLASLLSVACLATAAGLVHFPKYVYDNFFTHSSIYEDEYVDPASVDIEFPVKKRNLIYIFLESMETSYLSKDLGGGSEADLIPELYDLAMENQNFSHNDGVGGWPRVTHTTWTSAAMVAQTSGVPLTIDIHQIDLNSFKGYLLGATTLNDILHKEGYQQALMVGSDGSFGGRKEYFSSHNVDQVYDLFTAREDGTIPSDYMVWWGFEDQKLFDYAQEEILKLSQKDQPFAFTLLTADTHHVNGYTCPDCSNTHEEPYSNVISCSSRKVAEFVEWIRNQEFYENTTIIICGDHPSMDNQYFVRNIDRNYERHNYNCFINSAVETENLKNRVFTPMDLFPTTLAAMGCTIQGERLGLGTNLFSSQATLAERYGIDYLNKELSKRSDYYNRELIAE